MYEKDKKKERRKKASGGVYTCIIQGKKREISIRISRRREKTYPISTFLHFYMYTYITHIYIFLFFIPYIRVEKFQRNKNPIRCAYEMREEKSLLTRRRTRAHARRHNNATCDQPTARTRLPTQAISSSPCVTFSYSLDNVFPLSYK